MSPEPDSSDPADARPAPLKVSGEYHSYVVRIWRDAPGVPWRILVKEALTGRELHFVDSVELANFFGQITDRP